jgi:hypothetical protein
MSLNQGKQSAVDFAERVRGNQRKLRDGLTSQYDFIVCGSGSSGSVVARRLAENPNVSVLLLEAGGSDEAPSVTEAARWFENLGSERDWKFVDQPNPHLKGRSMPLGMGKVLGGGSSVNVMGWARGHKNDWDFFASESRETAWNYASVLNIYRRVEDWQGAPDPTRRGAGGLVFVQSAPDPNPIAPAMVEGARSIGMPTFDSNNGRLMEGAGGASIIDMNVRDGKRLSVFRSYVFPYMDRPNLTVLTHAPVWRSLLTEKSNGLRLDSRLFCRWARCTRQRCLCFLALAMRLSYDVWAYRSSSIFQVWGRTFRIIWVSAVSGSISNCSLLATMELRQRSSGRAILVLTLRICRPARLKYPSAAPRQAPSSIRRWLLGPCMEVSYGRKVAVRFA